MSDVRDAWWAMRHRVEREVASLSPDETTLVVSEVAPEPEPVKKGWFRRRPPPTPVRFISSRRTATRCGRRWSVPRSAVAAGR